MITLNWFQVKLHQLLSSDVPLYYFIIYFYLDSLTLPYWPIYCQGFRLQSLKSVSVWHLYRFIYALFVFIIAYQYNLMVFLCIKVYFGFLFCIDHSYANFISQANHLNIKWKVSFLKNWIVNIVKDLFLFLANVLQQFIRQSKLFPVCLPTTPK